MRKRVRWLHISDIHFRGKSKLDQTDAFKRLNADVKARTEDGQGPDLIFVTGDITFSGQRNDFAEIAARLDALCKSCQLSRQRVHFCPGNHDCDIGVAPYLLRGCWAGLTDASKFQSFLVSGEHTALKARQEEYRQFVRNFRGDDGFEGSDLHTVTRLQLEELNIAVVGINSSLLANGGPDDHGKLQVCFRNLEERYEKACGADLTFSLIHHPFEWLVEFEADRVERLVLGASDVVLRGHLHQPKLGAGLRGEIISAAGALWEEAAGDYEYSVGSIALQSATCEIETARYIQKNGTWMTRSETVDVPAHANVDCVPSLVRAALEVSGAALKYPAQIAVALSGFNNELMMVSNGTPNYFAPSIIRAQSLHSQSGVDHALGMLAVTHLVRFYGVERLEEVLRAEAPSLVAYDLSLQRACERDPEFAPTIAAREASCERHTLTTPTNATWAVKLLSRLVAQGDGVRIASMRDDSSNPLLGAMKLALEQGVRDPYEAWQQVAGRVLEFADLTRVVERLAVKGTLDLARAALMDAAEFYPLEARRLSEIARIVATEMSDSTVFTDFQRALEKP